VLPSDDASCFGDVQDVVSPFTFSLSPTDIAECRDVRIYWDPASVQGYAFFLTTSIFFHELTFCNSVPSFLSVIPDGAFRTIPLGKIDTQPGLGTGFTWRPAVRARTNLIIVAGDNRGMGSGGFISKFVNPGDSSVAGDCPSPTGTAAPTSSTF